MKKILPFALALLLLASAGAYVLFNKKADAPVVAEPPFITVRASDGGAELRIPKDAVLDGGKVGDITMIAIPAATYFKKSNQPVDLVKVYRLEPDGLKFSKPATVSVTFPYDQKKTYAPIFVVQSREKGEVASLAINDFQVDEKRGTFTVSGEVPHFTDFMANPEPHIFNARNLPEKRTTHVIGQPFDQTYILTPGAWEYAFHSSRYEPDLITHVRLELGNGTRWIVNPDYRSPHTMRILYGNMTPAESIRPKTNLASDKEYRLTTQYTCTRVGPDIPIVAGGTWVQYTLQFTTSTTAVPKPWILRDDRLSPIIGPDSAWVDCIAPSAGGGTSSDPGTGGTPAAKSPTSTTPKISVPKSDGVIMVCGLPGDPPCPKH